MAGIVYDTGALLAAERRSPRMWALHDAALARDVVPVVVLAQACRGGPQAELSRFLMRGCAVEAHTAAVGRAAGIAGAVAKTADVVDAIVVVIALVRQAVIFTSDPDDLARIVAALNASLRLHPV